MTTHNLAPELEPIVLAVLERRVREAKDAARVPLAALYQEGETRKVRSPLDDTVLGSVGRTSPDPAWKVVDRAALAKHLAADPANVEYVDDIAGGEAQVIEALAEHAPHLLAQVERVKDEAFTAAMAAAKAGTVVPGIERVKPPGVLFVRPSKDAGASIEGLVAAGWITYDGRPRQIEAPPVCPGCETAVDATDARTVAHEGRPWHGGCVAEAAAVKAGLL